ncbi:MAG: FkbM family methyltransferase [Rhodobacteraceae bacterium]|nr:FkbM family methyltransferase [Paracoccaceae bacterium]
MIKSELLAALRGGLADQTVMTAAENIVTGGLERTAEDIELALLFAQAAWIADQRNPIATRARDAAQAVIAAVPTLADGYRWLGFAHLSRGEYREAFTALSAVKAVPGEANFDNFRALAQNLMLGRTEAGFKWNDTDYVFPLSCHNAAAIEAGAFHSVGVLTETDELQALARCAAGRPIEQIAEIGVLIGNHTAFMLHTFHPDHLVLIDADPANIPLIEKTVRMNTPANTAPIVETVTAFVGRGGADVSFAGEMVPHRRLCDLVTGPVDLIKIDVDGAEIELLNAGGDPIERHRPLTLIETTPSSDAPVVEWFTSRGFSCAAMFDHGSYRNRIMVAGDAAP